MSKKIIEVIEKTEKELPWNFTATLPNGATVKVLGVCEHPSEGKQWWSPDGTPMERTFEKFNHPAKKSDLNLFELVYRVVGISDLLTDIGINDSVRVSSDWSDLTALAEKVRLENPDNCYPLLFSYKKGMEQIDVTILVGSDSSWKTITRMNATKGSNLANTRTKGAHVMIANPNEKDGRTRLNIAHDITDQQYRVIATDKNGMVNTCSRSSIMSNGNGLCMMDVEFDLPLAKIKSIQFQTQKFQSVTFKNISLRPSVEMEKQN